MLGAGQKTIELLYDIGSHIAAGDPLDEALSSVISFDTSVLQCDSCLTYVRDEDEYVLSVWKNFDHKAVVQSNLLTKQGIVEFLASHRQPAAVSSDQLEKYKFKLFPEWSQDKGETFISIPLLSRNKLVGVINLQHQHPRLYTFEEIKFVSSIGFLLGSEIRITCLERQNADLLLELETRKLVERGKGILQRELGLNEEQAYLALQRQSRQRRMSMREVAQAVILGEEVRRNALTN